MRHAAWPDCGWLSFLHLPTKCRPNHQNLFLLVSRPGHVGLGAGELGPCWCFPFARLRRPGPEIRSHTRPWGSRIPQHGSGQNQVWVFDFTKATGTGRRENKSQYWAQRRCYCSHACGKADDRLGRPFAVEGQVHKRAHHRRWAAQALRLGLRGLGGELVAQLFLRVLIKFANNYRA